MDSDRICRRDLIFLAGLALATISWSYALFRWGPALSTDSGYYISYALRLRNELDYAWGWPVYPPLLSLLTACVLAIVTMPADAGAWVAGLSLGVGLASLFLAGRELKLPLWVAAAATGCLLALPSVQTVAPFVWSENLLFATYGLHLYFLTRHHQRGGSTNLAGAALFAGLAPLAKYVGAAAVASFLIYVTLSHLGPRLSARFKLSRSDAAKPTNDGGSVWPSTLALAFVPHLIFNAVRSGTPTGNRPPARRAFSENISDLAATVGPELGLCLGLGLVLCLLVRAAGTTLDPHRRRGMRELTAYSLLFVFAQAGLLLLAGSIAKLDRFGDRFVAPLSFLLVAAMVSAVASFGPGPRRAERVSSARKTAVAAISIGLLGLAICRFVLTAGAPFFPESRNDHSYKRAAIGLSEETTGLKVFFRRAGRLESELSFTVLAGRGDLSSVHTHSFAGMLSSQPYPAEFMRGANISLEKIQDFTLDNPGVPNGELRQLRYQGFGKGRMKIKNFARFAREVSKLMDKNGWQRHWVLVDRRLSKLRTKPPRESYPPLRLTHRWSAGPFIAYRFERIRPAQ